MTIQIISHRTATYTYHIFHNAIIATRKHITKHSNYKTKNNVNNTNKQQVIRKLYNKTIINNTSNHNTNKKTQHRHIHAPQTPPCSNSNKSTQHKTKQILNNNKATYNNWQTLIRKPYNNIMTNDTSNHHTNDKTQNWHRHAPQIPPCKNSTT